MHIASASTTIKFHEFPTGNVIHNYQPGSKVQGPVKSLSWSKDGNWLVLVPHSGATEIVSVKDQLKLLKSIQNVDEPTCASFQNTSRKYIGIGTKSGLVLIFDVKARYAKKRFPRATSQITHVEFTAKDSHCVAACKNGDVLVYNNVTNSPPSLMRIPKSTSVSCLKTNKMKQNLILGGSNEGIVCVWDNNVNKSKFVMEAHKAPVNALSFSPLNSDLVLTTGSDRQCCFFDIVDNRCIANFSMQNSITAVDFSPDGTYFVMASQNGSIFIFDSRNIKEHVNSFQAHPSTIKHLLFQNISNACSTSSCDISIETTPVNSNESINIKSKRTSDMFRTFIPSTEITDGVPEPVRKSMVSMEGGDSFLAALGIENNNTTAESINNDDVFQKYPQPKLPTAIAEAPETPDTNKPPIVDKTELVELKQNQFTSTPVFLRVENKLEKSESPAEMKNIVQEMLKEEKNNIATYLKSIREEIGEVAKDLRTEIKNEATIIRRMLMDTQMGMVRESLKMEDWCNKLREDIYGENGRDINILLDENEKLRKKVEFLEDQLRNVSNKSEII